jgi:hypothetical protein
MEKEDKNEEQQEERDEAEVEEQRTIEFPPVNFENFVFGLYNTASIHMGIRDPETGELIQNLALARHTIDTLGMIQEKTKGNLTATESNLLENVLYNLRMGYLRAVKQPGESAESESAEEPETETEAKPAEEEKNETDDSEPESEDKE